MKIVSKIVIICCLVLFISFYVCTDAKGAVCGDIDGDGDVDCDDAVLVYDYVSGYGFLSYEQLDLADIDGDGGVTIADVSLIFHKADGTLDDIPFIPDNNGSFTMFSLPDKLEYCEGEDIDLSGFSAGIRYVNGDVLNFDDYTYSGYDNSPGVKIVTAERGGLKTSFSVIVYPAEIDRLEIISEPEKTVYSEGEELDLTGLSVCAIYSDGTSRVVDSYTVDGYEPVIGNYEITIKYRMKTISFFVNVE